jgi:hypothetical protein
MFTILGWLNSVVWISSFDPTIRSNIAKTKMIIHSLLNVISNIIKRMWDFNFRLYILIFDDSSGHSRAMMSVPNLCINCINMVWLYVREMFSSRHISYKIVYYYFNYSDIYILFWLYITNGAFVFTQKW